MFASPMMIKGERIRYFQEDMILTPKDIAKHEVIAWWLRVYWKAKPGY